MLSEHQIIRKIFAPLAKDYPGAMGLLDDAALLRYVDQKDLVVTQDMLVADIHFFPDDSPRDIGYKALAVNLSDLAAKGAKPVGYLLSIALPRNIKEAWLVECAEGLRMLQSAVGCHLIGGDTTSTDGPLTLSITAIGHLKTGCMINREGAGAGDMIYVTGTIGDAALGLHLRKDADLCQDWGLNTEHSNFLISRYLRPQPRVEFGYQMERYVSAAMDISDGLAGDLQKLCAVSNVGATIEINQIPLSQAVHIAVQNNQNAWQAVLAGGDDYELIICVMPSQVKDFENLARTCNTTLTHIGQVNGSRDNINIIGLDQLNIELSNLSYSHF
ncbi:MAG: thiamine-phosphate kinase [Pseudomonadota bacterium]